MAQTLDIMIFHTRHCIVITKTTTHACVLRTATRILASISDRNAITHTTGQHETHHTFVQGSLHCALSLSPITDAMRGALAQRIKHDNHLLYESMGIFASVCVTTRWHPSFPAPPAPPVVSGNPQRRTDPDNGTVRSS